MVEKLTFIWQQLWWTLLQSRLPIAVNLRHLWHCVTQLHILEWPFIVPSTRCTCVMIMLFNQLLDMPHLSTRWIILAKEKCSLTGIHLCTKIERNKLFVHMEHFWDILFQLMKPTLYIFLFSVLKKKQTGNRDKFGQEAMLICRICADMSNLC